LFTYGWYCLRAMFPWERAMPAIFIVRPGIGLEIAGMARSHETLTRLWKSPTRRFLEPPTNLIAGKASLYGNVSLSSG